MIPTSGSSGWSDQPTTVTTDEPSSLTQTAKESGTGVAKTATEQGKNVAGEAATQARHLASEAGEQVRQQAAEQQQRAAHGLRALADEMTTMADRGGQSGMATELARQASDRARQAASWLEARQPGDLIEELNRLGRRRPGMFLAGAAIAGVAAGRLTRGIAAASSGEATRAREAEMPRVPTQSTPTAGPPLPDPGGYATDEGSVIRDPAYGDPLTDPTRGRGVVP
jgi:hypothetical protein